MSETKETACEMENVRNFVEMAHQVGGHATTKTSLKSCGGKILKPFQDKRRGEREHAFYEHVFHAESGKPILLQLQSLIPRYHGMVVVSDVQETHASGGDGEEASTGSESHNRQHLAMEDLTWGRKWPCIMDVKVGTRSYENDATPEKIAYEKQKFPLQEDVGFRIQGIKVFDPEHQRHVEYDKHFGRTVRSRDDLVPAFGRYFATYGGSETKINIALLKTFLSRLEELKAWFDEQQELEFIASSLLFLYNGQVSVPDDDASPLDHALAADIRLIDFAHVTHRPAHAPQRDEGVRKGIHTIIQCFQELLMQQQQN